MRLPDNTFAMPGGAPAPQLEPADILEVSHLWDLVIVVALSVRRSTEEERGPGFGY